MSLYFQPSNKMPLGGIILFLLSGLVAAAGLALVYIYAVWYIPFVYINFLFCAGFGLVLGGVLMLLARASKLRNPRAVAGLGLLVGLAAVYLEWGVFLTLLFNSETTGTGAAAETSTSFSFRLFAAVLSHPAQMAAALVDINKTGTWSLRSATPATGIFLWLVWAVEAVFIAGGAYLLAGASADEPFSETANEWAEQETLAHPVLYAEDKAATRRALETGQLQHLTPHLADTALGHFARLKLHRAPNDPGCNFLSFENVARSLNSKGKTEETTTKVVQYLAVSPATCDDLKRRFGTAPAPAVPPGPSALAH